ncbi:PD40 domain-containing protein [Opitutus sp. GAS368]|uniref:TolB family protein n=1 Tax=Opitutus sp. GAS368 TaxID=1882749 RepID=UPI00087D533D|nr:PD40 domain-containing protein [Opitutus sp. GAS368]SDR88683.1 WD40-like Beta Propeller Repeat [Opitutus sp. GAS368]
MTRLLRRLASFLVLALATAIADAAVTLKINVSPAGATVVATETGQRLPAPAAIELKRRDNNYTFTIEKPGFQTETVSWNTREKVREIFVTLSPLTAEKEISIKSGPDGASVAIDGKPAGTTPLVKTATFTRDTKTAPWKPLAITVTKPDYQSESFSLGYDNPSAALMLGQLRKERVFSVEVKAPDGSAIAAGLTLEGKELGAAPQKVSVVFSRADKTRPWPTFALTAEIPTIYQPAAVTLTHDYKDIFALTLKPVTELSVGLYVPTVEMTATGARMVVNQAVRLATLDTGERATEIAGLSRLTRFVRRDQNPKAPLQGLNSYAITPDGESAILSVTSQDDAGKFYSALFLKRIEDDGGGTARLIDNNKRYFDCFPIIAPDGSGILVFQSNRGDLSKPDVFRINFADNRVAGGVSRITNDQRFNYGPTYTDSNREVVYLSLEPNYPLAKPQLSNVKLDGALPTQFQINAEEVSHREHSKVYFTRVDESTGKRQIYSVEPDGRLETNLISDDSFLAANCFNPVASFASPVRILFVSDRDKDDQGRANNNIYVMNADGSQVQQLTANGSDDILPAWSPTDPAVVYFLSNRGGAYNLWRLRLK